MDGIGFSDEELRRLNSSKSPGDVRTSGQQVRGQIGEQKRRNQGQTKGKELIVTPGTSSSPADEPPVEKPTAVKPVGEVKKEEQVEKVEQPKPVALDTPTPENGTELMQHVSL